MIHGINMPSPLERSEAALALKQRQELLDSTVAKVVARARKSHPKHGLYKSITYRSWQCMRQRCSDPNHISYPRYGGRGIIVDPRWDSFSQFFLDMGERPSLNFSLERKDNKIGYTKSNCVWITKYAQNLNRSETVWVDWQGERVQLCVLMKRYGLKHSTVTSRLDRGYTLEQALTKIPNHGARLCSRKLSFDKAESIRFKRSQGVDTASLAREFGVSRNMIQRILRGQHWSEPYFTSNL